MPQKRIQKSIRLRLDLAREYDRTAYDYLATLRTRRQCKGFLLKGAELARAEQDKDYAALAEMLPGFTAWVQAQATPPTAAPIAPQPIQPPPISAPPPDIEPEDLEEPDLDAFIF